MANQPTDNKSIQSNSSVDLGILVGLLLTDGWITRNKNTIGFSGKSEELHKIFKEKMNKIFGIKKFRKVVDKFGIVSTIVDNKEIKSELTKIIPIFRRKQFKDGKFPNCRIPEFFFKLRKHELTEIMKVMFSADGCVSIGVWWNPKEKAWKLKRRIQISSSHPIIRKQLAKLLKEKFNINAKIRWNGVVIENKSDIKKFWKEIRFVDGVKISGKSKNWKGFEKNQILDLAVKTLNLKKQDLKKFKSKEEVINFLKSLL
jgi:hypothetical protein